MRTVSTPRLTLEPQIAAHVEEMFVVLSDPAIYEYENAPPQSLDWLRTRFTKLETRLSGDGTEQWLNWVIRLPGNALAGYVQATVDAQGGAGIAYEMSSAHWGRGLGSAAVAAMMLELADHYGVRNFSAVLKAKNMRSRRLLERLGFALGTPEQHRIVEAEPDEIVMLCRSLACAQGYLTKSKG